jgi:zinc protease
MGIPSSNNIKRSVIGFLIFTMSVSAFAAPLPAGTKEVTQLAGITEYQLDNGLRVLLFPDSSSAKTTVNVTYLVGSRHEGYGETGMAHLLEHLLFKGSKDHPNITKELSDHGAQANGTTWFDRTNYYETFPSSPENLEWALSMESDRMVNSFIAKKDLDSEMTVVRNEFERGENDPGGILQERIFSTAFLWHNYGKSTIGSRSDIEQVPIGRLQAFYRYYYQPDNALLIVAGRFDEEKTLNLIAEKFGSIPRPQRELQNTYTEEPTQDGQREVELRRAGDTKVTAVAYHVPAGAAPDFAAVDVLGEILGDTPSGRLYKALVVPKLATSVGGGAYQLYDPGLMFLSASTRKDGDLGKVEQVLLETAQSFDKEPPTEDEVNRAKNALLKGMEATLRDSRRLALQLSEWEAQSDWRMFFLYKERLKAVTPADVARAAENYLKTSNRTVGRFVPEDAPARAEIAKVDQAALDATLTNLKIDQEMTAGEDFDPTPDNIKARTTYGELAPNIKLALLPKENRGETVAVDITFRFNNLEGSMNQSDVAGFTGAMLMRGTSKLTREQIKDTLTDLQASGSVSGDVNSVSASFSTTREHLPAVLKLAADIMKDPSFPPAELDTMREGYLAALEEAQSDPESRASLLFSQQLNPYPKGDPRASTTPQEDAEGAKKVTVEAMRAFHKKFYGAERGEVSVVGDFDPKEIEPLLKDLFVGWKAEGDVPYERLVDRVKEDVKPTEQSVNLPDKANAVYLSGKSLAITDEHPDYAALRLGNYMLGGGFLNSRLANRVRQQEGLSYSIRSSLSADSLDPAGGFTVYAIAAPANIDKVKAAVAEELTRALKDGFTPEEVEAAKRGYLEALKVQRSADSSLLSLLSTYMYYNRDLEWLNAWEAKINALTPEQIQEALGRHIDPADLVVVTAGTLKT